MLCWVNTILPSGVHFKIVKRRPNWDPKNLQKKCSRAQPTQTGEGVNKIKLPRPKFLAVVCLHIRDFYLSPTSVCLCTSISPKNYAFLHPSLWF